MTGGAANPQRVFVRAPNWLGDAVLALPAMAACRRHFVDAHLTVGGPPAVTAVLREHTDVAPDDVIDLPEDRRRAVDAIAARRFDLALLLPNSFQSAWQLRRARVPERWGYATAGRGWLLTKTCRVIASREHPHHSDYFRRLVRGLGLTCGDEDPRVTSTDAATQEARRLLDDHHVAPHRRFVGLAPGAAYGEAKQWPPANVAALAATLARERDVTCLLLGAAHDRIAARAMESWLRAHAPDVVAPPSGVVDLIGRTSVRALVGLVARCDAFVSNDSGAMHLAAALGKPVVALFGPTDERATRPLGDHDVITEPVFCRPCLLRDCPIDHRCMTRITVSRVFEAVSARLARQAPSPAGAA